MEEKVILYAALINDQIISMFDEDSERQIDIKDLNAEENLKAFFHALSTVAPTAIFNKMCQDDKNHLEFNHLANQLCFEFSHSVD